MAPRVALTFRHPPASRMRAGHERGTIAATFLREVVARVLVALLATAFAAPEFWTRGSPGVRCHIARGRSAVSSTLAQAP